MDSVIVKTCNSFVNTLNKEPSEIFDESAKEKMLKVCDIEDKEFDKLLRKLEVNLDCKDITNFKRCVIGLMRLQNRNRKILYDSLGRIY